MPRSNPLKGAARLLAFALFASAALAFVPAPTADARGDVEYTGKLEPELAPDTEDFDQVVFKPMKDLSKIKLASPLEEGANVTANPNGEEWESIWGRVFRE